MVRRNQTPRPPTSKANIWSHATKNSRRANRRVDLFPYIAASFLFFFLNYLSLPPPILCPILEVVWPRLLIPLFLFLVPSSRRLRSRLCPKMTPISQVKCTLAPICCLSAYVFLFSKAILASCCAAIDPRPYFLLPPFEPTVTGRLELQNHKLVLRLNFIFTKIL